MPNGQPIRLPHRQHIRPELAEAVTVAWRELGEAGSWLTGAQRVHVVACARAAWQCAGCDAQLTSLSPYAEHVDHTPEQSLPPHWVRLVHAVVRDSGRITRRLRDEVVSAGMSEDEYVEITSVAVLTRTVDAFTAGIGAGELPLPERIAGAPSCTPNTAATPGPGFVATTAPEHAQPDFADFYANDSHFYIRRALTLVQGEARRFWRLANALYLEDPRVEELDGVSRSITRAQIEFLATRASAMLGCYY